MNANPEILSNNLNINKKRKGKNENVNMGDNNGIFESHLVGLPLRER